jgi:hypothetical protein
VLSSGQHKYVLFYVRAQCAVLTQHVLSGAEYFATEVAVVLHFLCCIKTPKVLALLTQHVLACAEYTLELAQRALAGAEFLAAEVFGVLLRGSVLAVLTQHVLAAAGYSGQG